MCGVPLGPLEAYVNEGDLKRIIGIKACIVNTQQRFPDQAVTSKIYRLKQHFLPPEPPKGLLKLNK